MLSIAAINNVGYYSSLAEKDDYYVEEAEAAEAPGQWGKGAAFLGLSGTVKSEDFQAVMQGFAPDDGRALVQNAGKENHRAGWDLTFSAPKSVSVAMATATPERRALIERAQAAAITRAMEYVEQYAVARAGKGGEEKQHAQLLWAQWQHVTSRAQDPQLHTHVTVANCALGEDGKWRSLEPKEIFRAKMAAGAIYRAELAQQLQQAGYQVERDGDCFKLAGGSAAVEEHFSKRRAEIVEILKEKGMDSAKAAEVVALDSREKKEILPRAELYAQWQAEAAGLGFEHSQLLNAEAAPVERLQDDKLLESLTEKSSVFRRQQLEAAVAINELGRSGFEEIQNKIDKLLKSEEIVALQNPENADDFRYTTRAMLDLEKTMIETGRDLAGKEHRPARLEDVERVIIEKTLSGEQAAALRQLAGPGQLACLVGVAGAGKSYTLGAARETWEGAGLRVLGCALGGKAAAGLQDGAGIVSTTIHGLLRDIEEGKQALDPATVLVVDEAGMVGSRQTARLVELAAESGTKLVLVGDHHQLQAIDAGAAFRGIVGAVGAAEMLENRRQRDSWAIDAAKAVRDGDALAALAAYHEHGLLHRSENPQQAAEAMAADWGRAVKNSADLPNHLMLAATRAEVVELNRLAREQLAQRGLLGSSAQLPSGSGQLEVREGDRLIFLRNNNKLDVKNGTLGTITEITERKIVVRTDNGREINLKNSDYEHLAYGYAVTTHKAQGVTVDHSYVLASNNMSGKELAYVQLSRHRDSAHIFISGGEQLQQAIEQAASGMSRAGGKEISTDYARAATPGETPEQAAARRLLERFAGDEYEPQREREKELELELEM